MPRHDTDAVALVAGIIFGGAALAFLINDVFGSSGRWVWPVVLIVVGVVGLMASRIQHRNDPPGSV